jgi:hypothetical protein
MPIPAGPDRKPPRSLSENAISEKTTTTYSADPLKLTVYVVVRILDYEFSDSLLGADDVHKPRAIPG